MAKNQFQSDTSTLQAVGIDVSKDNLMFCKKYSPENKITFEIKNRKPEIRKIAMELEKENYEGKIIIESTGRHHLLSALEMSQRNLDVRVINPLIANKYIKSSIRKVKTDKRDAEVLASIAVKEENLPQRFDSDKNRLKIKKKVSLVSILDKQLQRLSASINEFERTIKELGIKLSKTEKQIFKTIKLLKEQKKKLEKEIETLMAELEYKQGTINRYESISGVSKYTASLATLFFKEIEYNRSAKQWIAFTGLDVSIRESGHWRGKGKITKRGNAYLRKRLFQAAWGAVMHDDKFKSYYNYLKNNKGKSYIESLIIIARKIITIMFALSKNKCFYDHSKELFVPSI